MRLVLSRAAPLLPLVALGSSSPVDSPTAATPATPSVVPTGGLAPSAAATALSSPVAAYGTWYGETCGEEACWQGGACAFVDYKLPAGIHGSTCWGEKDWNSAYNCGGCVEVTYNGKKVVLMVSVSPVLPSIFHTKATAQLTPPIVSFQQITNKTDGNQTHIDMSPNAFAQLDNKSKGLIRFEYRHVPCPISTPLMIRMHGGASQYWFAATVENAVLRTATLDVSTDKGVTWKTTKRDTNNFFVFPGNGGSGAKTAWIRVTSELGTQVIVKDVVQQSDVTTTATENYAMA